MQRTDNYTPSRRKKQVSPRKKTGLTPVFFVSAPEKPIGLQPRRAPRNVRSSPAGVASVHVTSFSGRDVVLHQLRTSWFQKGRPSVAASRRLEGKVFLTNAEKGVIVMRQVSGFAVHLFDYCPIHDLSSGLIGSKTELQPRRTIRGRPDCETEPAQPTGEATPHENPLYEFASHGPPHVFPGPLSGATAQTAKPHWLRPAMIALRAAPGPGRSKNEPTHPFSHPF